MINLIIYEKPKYETANARYESCLPSPKKISLQILSFFKKWILIHRHRKTGALSLGVERDEVSLELLWSKYSTTEGKSSHT